MKGARLLFNGLAVSNPHTGVGSYSLRLMAAATRVWGRDRVTVMLPAGHAARAVLEPEMGVEEVPGRCPVKHPLAAAVWWGARILREASRRRDAVFHSPCAVTGWHRPERTVVTLHDCLYRTFTRYQGRGVARGLWLRATERYARGAGLVLTDSEAAARDLVRQARIPEERVRVLYPWVDDRFLRGVAAEEVSCVRERLGLPGDYWLYLGGYDYRKDVGTLVRAYARVPGAPPLVLAGALPKPGAGPVCDVPGVLRETGLAGSGRLVFPGRIDDRDLPALYAGARLFVYPSRGEGFGLPPAEAMALGVPVLVADNTSLPEVVRDAARRFPTGDVSALASRLAEEAAGSPRAAAGFPEEFTERRALERYAELLAEMA